MIRRMQWLRPIEDDEDPGKGPSLEEKLHHLSPTKLDMALRCMKQVEWRYIMGVKIPPAIALVEGGQYHNTAAYRNEHAMNEKKVSCAEMHDFFTDNFKDLLNKGGRKDIDWQDDDEESLFRRSDQLIKVLHGDLAPRKRPSSVEEEFDLAVDGIPFKGIADLVEGKSEVVDYKVTGKKKNQNDVDSSLQLTLYAKKYKVKKVRLDNLCKSGGGVSNRLYSTRSAGDFEWLAVVAHAVWRALTTGNFPPCDPGHWVCSPKYCGWYSRCRGAHYRRTK